MNSDKTSDKTTAPNPPGGANAKPKPSGDKIPGANDLLGPKGDPAEGKR